MVGGGGGCMAAAMPRGYAPAITGRRSMRQAPVAERRIRAPACMEERMHQSSILQEAETLEERPTCEHCGSRMWLARIAPEREDHERRIFECPVCTQSEAKVVKFR